MWTKEDEEDDLGLDTWNVTIDLGNERPSTYFN